jgi:prepilin-type N-terminal cleavage/methylation domain-containing protein
MLLRTKHQSNQGFTLIEILVTIMIGGILAAIAAPNFMTWVDNKKINDAATKIEGALREAQSSAGRRNITCDVVITATQVSASNPKCLPSGTLNIQDKAPDVGISNSNLGIAGTGGSTGTTVTYLSIGTANITPNSSTIVVYKPNETTSGTKKCIVVSKGIGTIKTGTYTGTLSTGSSPFGFTGTPTSTQLDTVAGQCVSS